MDKREGSDFVVVLLACCKRPSFEPIDEQNEDETDKIDRKRSKIKEQEDIIRKESESAFKYFCLKQIYLKKVTFEAISNFLKRKGHSAVNGTLITYVIYVLIIVVK